MTHIEALKLALAALQFVRHRDSRWHDDDVVTPAITAIDTALKSGEKCHRCDLPLNDGKCLYTTHNEQPTSEPVKVDETAGQLLQRLGMDGKLWAEEMHKRIPEVSEDDLLGWCCNMIMAGYDEAMRRCEATPNQVKVSVKHIRENMLLSPHNDSFIKEILAEAIRQGARIVYD